MFKGRQLVIATKHKKENVIAPLAELHLGVKCIVPESFDTDTLGTFSGEIERKDDPIVTLRNKCMQAMQLSNCDMGIASEGSFGSHPFIPFAPADDEFLIFIDSKNGLEIIVRELSTETNLNAAVITTEKELYAFAKHAKFPTHGLILRKAKDDFLGIEKGITDSILLEKIFRELFKQNGEVYAETDMRAMYNPTRLAVIEKAAIKLIEKINSRCTQCNAPGFGITNVKPGLPCSWCGMPTRSTLSYLYVCAKCNFEKEEMFPNKKEVEEPTFCDFCNP